MTVIATDGKTIAADTLSTIGSERVRVPCHKVVVAEEAIYALAGAESAFPDVVAWWRGNEVPERAPFFGSNDVLWRLLVISRGGAMHCISNSTARPTLVAPPFAIGSGGDVALGAMLAGASPKRACEIACEVLICCGGPVVEHDVGAVVGSR